MTRPTVEEWALDILRATQARATCDRGRCSALILKDSRILASGYVGSPQGLPHCDDVGHEFQETWIFAEIHPGDGDDFYEPESGGFLVKKKSCIRTIHAEQNAIAWAAREGIALKGGTLHSTLFPCQSCAKLIMQAGIEYVIAEYDYHSSGHPKTFSTPWTSPTRSPSQGKPTRLECFADAKTTRPTRPWKPPTPSCSPPPVTSPPTTRAQGWGKCVRVVCSRFDFR